jgi:multimeric flavodoxin WrbA
LGNHATKKIYLYDYLILPCLACSRCKKDDFTCALKDGMPETYPRLERADLIVFGTPVYWYGPTAKTKLLIDRIRPFIASGKLKGKRGIVVPSPTSYAAGCAVARFTALPMTSSWVYNVKISGLYSFQSKRKPVNFRRRSSMSNQ